MVSKGKQATPKATSAKKVRGKGKRTNSMRLYVKKLAKIHMDDKLQMSAGAAEKLELMCDHMIDRFTRRAGTIVEMKKSRTLNANCVQGALSLELHPTLAKLCDDEGVKACLKLQA
jgi:histone H3/H4